MAIITPASEVYSTGKAEKIIIEKSIDEIRKGNGYFATGMIVTATDITTNVFILPQKTTTAYHITFKFSTYPYAEVTLYEGTGSATTGSVGTHLTSFNMNRVGTTGSLWVVQGITTGASGTGSLIFYGLVPEWATVYFGSSQARQNEIILDTSQSYILTFSGSGAGRVGYEIYWYEQ